MPIRLVPLLLLAACSGPAGNDKDDTGEAIVDNGTGEVSISGLDEFGTVASAIWYRETNDDSVADRVVLSTVAGACEKQKSYAAASAAYSAAVEDISEADWCTDAKAPSLALARASAALNPAGSRYVRLSVADMAAGDSLWHEGTYGTEDMGAFLFGTVGYYDGDMLAAYDDWDESGTYDDGCGVRYDEDAFWFASATSATLEVTSAATLDRTTGQLDGGLREFGGAERTGSIAATFDAVWCEVE